jgi:hypothetical protein
MIDDTKILFYSIGRGDRNFLKVVGNFVLLARQDFKNHPIYFIIFSMWSLSIISLDMTLLLILHWLKQAIPFKFLR